MKASFLGSGVFENITLTTAGTAVFVVLLVAMVIAAIAVNVVPRLVHKWEIEYKTRDLTYGAVCLAMSYALSWARMFSMPLGGSVTPAALAPLYIYCYYFGFRKGMAVSTAYALLQFTQGVYVVHPLSAFFDYLLPCFSICIVGLFKYNPTKYAAFVARNKEKPDGAKNATKYWAFTLGGHWRMFAGVGIHMVVRYASLVISGAICWDWWGYDPAPLSYKLSFSFGYNSFSLVDGAIALAAVILLLSSRAFTLYMSASFADKKAFYDLTGAADVAEAEAGSVAETAESGPSVDRQVPASDAEDVSSLDEAQDVKDIT